jgi:predicted metal-dependent peptidase
MLTDERIQKKLDKICPDHVSTEELNESVQDTYRKCAEGEGCGNMVSELTAFAREMLKPKVNWRTVLQNAVRTAETTEYKIREKDNYKRPSRRTKWGGGVILPKKAGQKLNIVMSFDTSGSISHELVNQFMAEVKRALQFSEIKKCYLWNTSVYWSGSEKDMQRDLEKIFQSGGTDGECLVEIGEDIKADLFIHMTDGCFTYPNQVRGKHLAIEWDNNEIKKVRKI